MTWLSNLLLDFATGLGLAAGSAFLLGVIWLIGRAFRLLCQRILWWRWDYAACALGAVIFLTLLGGVFRQ